MNRILLFISILPSLALCQELAKYIPSSFELKNAPVASKPFSKAILHGPRTEKRIALTFDACATLHRSRYDSSIVKALLTTNTPATLFLCGKWAIEHIKETRYLSRQPLFEIGNHSFIHPHLLKVTAARMKEELTLTQDILFTISGKVPALFRSPYGEISDSIVHCGALLGLKTIQYDLASGDPDTSISAKKLIEYVSTTAKNGSIIVMHMNKRGWHTAEALPEIIDRLRERGFIFVKVSELVQ